MISDIVFLASGIQSKINTLNRFYRTFPCSHQLHDDVIKMETFSALLALCAGNLSVIGEFPAQRSVMQSFVFFNLRLNKLLSKQSLAGDLRRHRTHHDVIVVNVMFFKSAPNIYSSNRNSSKL